MIESQISREQIPFGNPTESLTAALKRHELIQAGLRKALVSDTDGVPNPVDAAPTPEKTVRTFKKIVFGHPATGFDRDQLITYYLALRVGAVSESTPFEFSAEPTDEQFADPSTMVIESSVSPSDQKKTVKLGNYLTGAQDEPAATMFAQHFSRQISAATNGVALQELASWLRAVDTRVPRSKPLEYFDAGVLQLITPLFYALKLGTQSPEEMISKMVAMLDEVVAHPKNSQVIAEKYQAELDKAQKKRQAEFAQLEARAREPEFLKKTTTMTGVTLAYFDVRGLDIESGGLAKAREATGADVVFLIDTVKDPNDSSKVLGTQLIISSDKPELVGQSLADRLQMSEMLFGKGFKLSRLYGGHPGIISSPAWLGSDLKPENVWVALQKHFNAPRFSQEEFITKSHQLAERLGLDKGIPQLFLPPSDEYSLAEWQMQLTIPDDEEVSVIIKLSESDLPLYEACFTDDVEKNRQLLLRKTVVSEPEEIVALRIARAKHTLPELVKNQEATQILLMLDDLNKKAIEQLSFDQQLSLLEAISLDQLAIDQVWNKDNMLFQIAQNLPDWIEEDLKVYKAERFKFTTLPTKVDSYLLSEIIGKLETVTSAANWEKVLTILSRILFSKAYKATHQEQSYDTLLTKYLHLILKPSIPPQLAIAAVERLEIEYGPGMQNHWQTLSPQLISQLREAFPNNLSFVDSWFTREEVKTKDTRFMVVKEPDLEKLNGPRQTFDIYVKIGRNAKKTLEEIGIDFWDETGKRSNQKITEFASEITVDGTLRLDREHAEHEVVADEIVRHILVLLDAFPTAKIRVLASGFPNVLTEELGIVIPPQLNEQVSLCYYDIVDGVFIDRGPRSRRRKLTT